MDVIRFRLNGREVEVSGADPHTSLLQYLRAYGLTGVKEGCAEGECGACAVALVGHSPRGGSRYVPVNSCLLLLPLVHGHEVYTVEALARGQRLHPVQQAMVASGGSQCGYCTPGFIMSLFAEYYRPGRKGFDLEALSGNLCRCTGYRPIRDAARSLGPPDPDDPFARRLGEPPPSPGAVAYGSFYRPANLDEVFSLLAAHSGARMVAGGTDVAVEVNQRHLRFPALISLEAVPELKGCRWEEGAVEVGAGVTLSELEERVAPHIPLLAQLLPLFASPLIRNRATLGGNLCTASPIGDAAPVLLALDAHVRLASPRGERLVPLTRFFVGYRRTALAPDEVLVAVRIPLPLPAVARFYKVAKRQRDDISTVAAAFALDLDRQGRVARVRLAYGGVAPTPVRLYEAEEALNGKLWSVGAVREAQAILAQAVSPISDHRGSAEYRRALVVNLLEKFFHDTQEVVACAV